MDPFINEYGGFNFPELGDVFIDSDIPPSIAAPPAENWAGIPYRPSISLDDAASLMSSRFLPPSNLSGFAKLLNEAAKIFESPAVGQGGAGKVSPHTSIPSVSSSTATSGGVTRGYTTKAPTMSEFLASSDLPPNQADAYMQSLQGFGYSPVKMDPYKTRLSLGRGFNPLNAFYRRS
jgi:hypothetical protein